MPSSSPRHAARRSLAAAIAVAAVLLTTVVSGPPASAALDAPENLSAGNLDSNPVLSWDRPPRTAG